MQNIYDLRDHFYQNNYCIESKELLEFRLPNTDLNKATKLQLHITQTSAKTLLSESFVEMENYKKICNFCW